MRMFKIFILVFVFTGCSDGFNFETEAIYYAEESDLKVNLKAKGFILHGHDLSFDGVVEGNISSTKFLDSIYFQSSESKVLDLKYKNESVEVLDSLDFNLSLIHVLNKLDFKEYNIDEVKELGEIIQLTAAGPKATNMEGQTEFVKVLNVDYRTF